MTAGIVGRKVVNKDGKEGVVTYLLNGTDQVVVSYNGVEAVEDKIDLTIKEERRVEQWRVYKINDLTSFESSNSTSPIAMFEPNLTLVWEGYKLVDVLFNNNNKVQYTNLPEGFIKFGGG